MGTTKLSQEELALRIDGEKVIGTDGITRRVSRYELAYKPEVKAFVDQRLKATVKAVSEEIEEQRVATTSRIDAIDENVTSDRERIITLEDLVAELRLTRWQRFKRGFNEFIEALVWAVTFEPDSVFDRAFDRATILPHGTRAELDAEDTAAFALEAQRAAEGPSGLPNPYEHLARSLREMPTECAEDLAENPVIQEAIDHIKKFEGVDFDPNRYRGLAPPPPISLELPELQGLPEYTAEEMPLIPESHRTHDGELELRVCHECGVMVGGRHKDGCVTGAIAAIEAFEKHGTPLPQNVHRLSIPPAESLGDPEE